MISEEAVLAAAAAASCMWSMPAENHPFGDECGDRLCRGRARRMLEAAEHVMREEFKADLWDEGERAGRSRAMRMMSDEPGLKPAVNPYRKLRTSSTTGREHDCPLPEDEVCVWSGDPYAPHGLCY